MGQAYNCVPVGTRSLGVPGPRPRQTALTFVLRAQAGRTSWLITLELSSFPSRDVYDFVLFMSDGFQRYKNSLSFYKAQFD